MGGGVVLLDLVGRLRLVRHEAERGAECAPPPPPVAGTVDSTYRSAPAGHSLASPTIRAVNSRDSSDTGSTAWHLCDIKLPQSSLAQMPSPS
jgi:hypothetical protein